MSRLNTFSTNNISRPKLFLSAQKVNVYLKPEYLTLPAKDRTPDRTNASAHFQAGTYIPQIEYYIKTQFLRERSAYDF